jgi:hypothetical protein
VSLGFGAPFTFVTFVPFVTVVLVGCASADVEPRTADGNVESGSFERGFVVATNLDAKAIAAQRATGVAYVPVRDQLRNPLRGADGTPIRATCGTTFVSRRHAITAAHCVSEADLDSGERFVVQLLDVAPDVDWRATTRVAGRFPAFQTRRVDAGYRSTDLRCSVKVRCEHGALACSTSADIALLECDDDLPADREPARVAASDDESGPVRMFWFHEIYDVRKPSLASGPGGGPAFESETFEDLHRHYTVYPKWFEANSLSTNFHYFGGERNQIFPLTADAFADGQHPRRLGRDGFGNVTTDLFGCHGTSGSGVFQENAETGELELLGPVTIGNEALSTRLCMDPDEHGPGMRGISYMRNEVTRWIAALAR